MVRYPQNRQDIRALLTRGAWFGALPARLQDRILERSVVRSFERGQMFQLEESPALGLMAVLAGRVHCLRSVNDSEPALIHVGAPGFWFGEMSVLMDDQALVTVVAQTEVRVLLLLKPDFERIVGEDPAYYKEFARLVFSRFRFIMRFLAEGRGLTIDERLRFRVAELAALRRDETRVDGPTVLDLSQSELARMVGVSRQKLNARLQRLEEEGWIARAPRVIQVLDPDGLRASLLPGRARRATRQSPAVPLTPKRR